MRILSHIAFLVLLGGIWCQNNRNAKTPKSPKKPGGSQGADVGQSPPVVSQTTGSSRSRGSAEAGQEGAAAGGRAAQQTDEMRLHFLRNTRVTCNDRTAAGWDALVSTLLEFFPGYIIEMLLCKSMEWIQKLHKHFTSFLFRFIYGSAGFT